MGRASRGKLIHYSDFLFYGYLLSRLDLKLSYKIAENIRKLRLILVQRGRKEGVGREIQKRRVHCKNRLAIFPSPAGMSLTKLSLAVTSLLGKGKSLTFFTVYRREQKEE